jgi:DUF2075 family protein
MEDAATEFQVQGLELDCVCVTWDADFRFAHTDWSCHSFVSSKWQHMKKLDRRQYLRNAYRVLLTRARQGMVIFVPPGDAHDPPGRRSSATPPSDTCRGLGYRWCEYGPSRQLLISPHAVHGH